jgi:hypothetical protein
MAKKEDKIGQIVRALVGLDVQHHGLVMDVVNKLAGPNGGVVHDALAQALRASGKVEQSRDTTYLRFLEAAELPATSGRTTIAQSAAIFAGFLDGDFHKWGTDVEGEDTVPATALVYEMKRNGTFADIFNSLPHGKEGRELSQGQIISFCEKHPHLLRQNGYATFFRFKVGRERFVADVNVASAGRRVYVYRFDHGNVWHAGLRHRVVVLQ